MQNFIYKNNSLHWLKIFKEIYTLMQLRYQIGTQTLAQITDPTLIDFLKSIGASLHEIGNLAQDSVKYGEPDWETVLLLTALRRDYFLNVQQKIFSHHILTEADLPEGKEAIEGIEWLPRIIRKAEAKLRGELADSIMFCCGGDRKFFKEHSIHPADFLRAVWMYEGEAGAMAEFVRKNHA